VLSYTTTLSCGHTFHDECIVPKLNEELRCPTCHAEVDAF
jgi:predicted Zn-ribbon and HTH transcriptional regulator